MSDIRIKSATLDIADEGGIVEGYAATFDREPDSYGDVIAPGAFAETVESWNAKTAQGIYVPLLYGHNTSDPEYNIGRITEIREDERGLWVHGELDAENEKAQYVRKLAREIITAIDGLLVETTHPDMDEEDAKQAQTVTAAQPQTVSPKQAEILAYIDQITQ